MTLLDCRLSLTFEKLFIPLIEIQEGVLDLGYEGQHYRFKYPQEVPHIMPLKEPFTKEKNQMTLTFMVRTGKKYRKIAKGEINFYKKYFLTDKLAIDKWVYLDLYETQLEQMGYNSNIQKTVSNTGKIYMKAQLLDPLLEDEKGEHKMRPQNIYENFSVYTANTHASAMTKILKKNLKNLPNIKDKTQQNKSEKFKSVTEHGNEFLRNLKDKKNAIDENLYEDIEEEEVKKQEEFNDGLSDVSISIIDGTEEGHLDIENLGLHIDNMANQIKLVFENKNKLDSILPEEPNEVKGFVSNLTTQIRNIYESYSENLLTLSDINKRIKFQAKDYYERYREKKRNFKKERRDLKNKNRMLEYETKLNIEENRKIQNELKEIKNELEVFKNRVGVKDDNINKDEDVQLMIEILNTVKNSDCNADILVGLDDTQKASLFEILGKFNNQSNNNQVNLTEEDPNVEEIINKIEFIVNDNFSNKKIMNIKIDQLSNDTFKFNDKAVVLYIEDDTLLIRDKTYYKFEDWLVLNFGLNNEKPPAKNIPPVSDRKLAEKKAMLFNATVPSRPKTPVLTSKKKY